LRDGSELRKIVDLDEYASELAEMSALTPEEIAEFYRNINAFPLGESGLEIGMRLFKSKWVVPIFTRLMRCKSMRYGELKRSLTEYGITNHTLSKTLDEMEDDLLIIRTVYEGVPPRVEYSLTKHAIEFLPAMAAFSSWARTHLRLIADKKAAEEAAAEAKN